MAAMELRPYIKVIDKLMQIFANLLLADGKGKLVRHQRAAQVCTAFCTES
jgi:hypothetical protein